MTIVKLIFGVLLLLLGWIFLYKPQLVLSINRIVRDTFFSDRRVLLERKKLAILFFCLSFVLIYMGYTSLARKAEHHGQASWIVEPHQYAMYIATQDYYAGRYESALKRCKEILPIIPEKVRALKCMAFCYLALGDTTRAETIFSKIQQLDPHDQLTKIKLQQLQKSVGK